MSGLKRRKSLILPTGVPPVVPPAQLPSQGVVGPKYANTSKAIILLMRWMMKRMPVHPEENGMAAMMTKFLIKWMLMTTKTTASLATKYPKMKLRLNQNAAWWSIFAMERGLVFLVR